MGYPHAFGQGLETAPEELDIPRGRRDIALVHFAVCNLAGLRNVPEHWGVSPFALCRCASRSSSSHEPPKRQCRGHVVPALQARLQETAVDFPQGIPCGLCRPTLRSQLPGVTA